MKFLKKPQEPESFYIGYQPEAPPEYKKFGRLLIAVLAVIVYVAVSWMVSNQSAFSNAIFNHQSFTTVEGSLQLSPFAAIKTFYGKDLYGNPVLKTIPLVNYGKFGADPIIQSVADANNGQLNNLWVTLRGHLIFHHGTTIMELTEKEKSVLKVEKVSPKKRAALGETSTTELDTVTLHGQIIDPKCYLGAMKPGEGKPHSDCAVRCIAGGIQPLLLIRDKKGQETFFVLRGKEGQPINNSLLSFIGFPVAVKGSLSRVDDWLIIKSDPATEIVLLNE